MMMGFPHGMRLSTLADRKEFYKDEFDIRAVSRWIGDRRGAMKFAMILGRRSGIVDPRHAKDKNNVVIIDDWNRASDVRSYAVDYLPEGLYYDRNRYRDVSKCADCVSKQSTCFGCDNFIGQQLAFDLDPENVDCPYHGHIGEKMQRNRIIAFCMIEFKSVRRQAVRLAAELRGEYEDVSIVFSGRGFHVVVDDEAAYALSKKQRTDLARRIGRRYDIDEWVTAGESRLMRLPFSLNALVSRKCMIIKEERDLVGFDPRTSKLVLPEFVRQRSLLARTSLPR
jgi:DNA primase catalytic subunit